MCVPAIPQRPAEDSVAAPANQIAVAAEILAVARSAEQRATAVDLQTQAYLLDLVIIESQQVVKGRA